LESQQGLSYARNRGIKESKGEYLAFIDDDAKPLSDYLVELEKAILKNSSMRCFGGKVIPDFEVYPKWLSSRLETLFAIQDLGNKEIYFQRNSFPIGANMIIKKELFDQVGDFNVELGRKGGELGGGEEKDFFLRLKINGEKFLFLPKVEVIHSIPARRITVEYIRNQGIGSGYSEFKRIDKSALKMLGLFTIEFVKWLGSLVLFVMFMIKIDINKGVMILKFRYWVTQGLFKGLFS
jgi:glycosyltransferase involved in cell wall biosynthesis